MKKRCAVLVSGGVDSSVALGLLKKQGDLELEAFYLKIWLEDELSHLGNCPWEEDLKYARDACELFGVPLTVLSLQREYWDLVVNDSVSELKAGRTPSPDLLCNQRVKFGAFWQKVGQQFDFVATGHYAQVQHGHGVSILKQALDPVKDQSYFLAQLSQAQLSRLICPLGALAKAEVRGLARSMGLSTAERPDSQGICFLGKIPYNAFVEHHLGTKPGPIIERATGKILGKHEGAWFHTIGQRKGLGLSGGPWYVVAKDLANQRVYVAHYDEAMAGAPRLIWLEPTHWLSGVPESLVDLRVKLRHGPKTIELASIEIQGQRSCLELTEVDKGVAPGQYAVIYQSSQCLGSGLIQDFRP